MGRSKKTPLEWAYEHSGHLKKAKERIMQISVSKDIEDNIKSLGDSSYSPGYWTILKNISLAYCLTPIGIILNSHKITDTVFLDLFSGSGITPLKDTATNEKKWIVGSPIISTCMTDYPFERYVFGDIRNTSVQLLSKILDCQEKELNCQVKYKILSPQDANINFKHVPPHIYKRYIFAYIDPTGFQWNWESMEKLLGCRMYDILMNFQTREVDRLTSDDKIVSFFGPCSSKIAGKNCDEKLNLYINQIREHGAYVTPIRIGKDRTDSYYYHLLHIARKDSYSDIISTMKSRIETFTGDSIKRIWNDLHGNVRQTTLFNSYT